MGSTLTTFDALMKQRYLDTSKVVEKLMYPDNVLLGMLEKKGDTGMVGSNLPVPIISANPQGVGGVFSTAQTNVSNITASKFLIVAGDYYGVVPIGDKVLEASRTNAGAFLEDKQTEIDGLYEQMSEGLSISAWSNGGNNLGQAGAIATNTITMLNSISAQNFEVGMTVVVSAGDGSNTTDSLRTGSTTVSAVNRSTGVVTLTDASQLSGFTAGDYMFRQGDFYGNTTAQIMQGVQAFVTGTDAPPALWGVTAATRALDPQRFAGCRITGNDLQGKSYEERIKILLAYMQGRFKARMPTAGFMNPEDFQVLETLMQAKGIRALEDDNTKFGYMKVDIMAAGGRIPIYCDRHCPLGTFFALRLDDWWISSMGDLLHPQNGDGFEILRKATSTDYEYRLISYPLVACRAPKNSGRVSLTA